LRVRLSVPEQLIVPINLSTKQCVMCRVGC